MSRQMKTVTLTVLAYGALTTLVSLFVQWAPLVADGSELIGASTYFLAYVILVASLLIGSIWIARSS